MFPDLEFIKTALNAIRLKFRRIKSDVDAVRSDVDAVKSSSPDWNEPNSASHAYIKNKPFGKRLVITGTSAMSHQGAAFIASNVPENALVVGRYYAVYVDGKLSLSAECVADTENAYPSLYYPGSADWADSSIHLRPDGRLIAWTSDRMWSTEGLPVEIYEVTQIPPEYLTAPDWNESDTASNSYVKNKPCYDYIEPSVVIWESDSAGISSQYAIPLVDLGDGWLIEGETYRLTVDGVETTYVCAADADGMGLYIGVDSNNGRIFQSNTNASLSALTSGLWDYGQKVRLEGPLRKYKKLNASMYDAVEVDSTLTQSGQAADAAEVGNRISSLSEDIAKKANNVYIGPVQPTDGTLYWLDTSGSGGSGGETVTHTVTAALTNVSIDNTAESVNDGASFAATLTAADGYTISSVTVTMGGEDITASAYANGNIYIASVTGDVVITADAVEVPGGSTTYTITNNLLHATSDNSAVSVEENAAYTAKLTAETDYALETVTVTMGGVDVTADVYADGVINIPAVTGDVVITATTVYAPTSPVFELAEPFTGTGSGGTVLDYNIVDEDKTFSVAIDYSATPTTGIYVFGAGNASDSLGIRGQGGYYWFAQSQYYKTAEIAYSTVTNKKVVLTYEKGSGNLLAHHVKTDGTAETITLAKGWTTGASSTTAVNPNGTINDLKIYARVLDESEINAYLGVK